MRIKRSRYEQWCAIKGGILPDMFVALSFVAHYLAHVTQSPLLAEIHTLLRHSALHAATVSMQALLIVGPFIVLSTVLCKPALPCFVGMFAHGIADFLTHRPWAYNHFFPLPFAPIGGIISYTDEGCTIVEHALLLLFVAWWRLKR